MSDGTVSHRKVMRGIDMKYKCKLCGEICETGKNDPGNGETADEHIICCHYKEILKTFFERIGRK